MSVPTRPQTVLNANAHEALHAPWAGGGVAGRGIPPAHACVPEPLTSTTAPHRAAQFRESFRTERRGFADSAQPTSCMTAMTSSRQESDVLQDGDMPLTDH